MFSVIYTGMNFFQLCTARVCPINSGTMVERRDHVRTTFFSFFAFMALTLSARWSSTNGPLCSERPMTISSSLPFLGFPRHDEPISALVIACLEAARGLAPRSPRMTAAAGLTLSAAVRMIHRIHRNAAIVRHFAHPALASGLAQAHIFVLDVAHLADGRGTLDQHFPDFTRRQF